MAVTSNKPWYRLTVKEVLNFFDVNYKTGLSATEAIKRLKHFGKNESANLPKYSAHLYKATVFRDSKLKKIEIGNIVVGDIIVIRVGDRVPADLRLIRLNNLKIDESLAFGNNVNSYKNTYACKDHVGLDSQKCMAFADTFVTEGNGVGVVVSVGKDCRINQYKQISKFKIPSFKQKPSIKKFSSKGIYIQRPNILSKLKNIDTVIFYGNYDNEYILAIISKLQLRKNLHTLFILKDINQALKSALPPQAVINYPNLNSLNEKSDLQKANVITGVPKEKLVRIINILKTSKGNTMIVFSGENNFHILLSADVSLVIGKDIKDNIGLLADMRSESLIPEALASILYNNK